MVDCWADIDPRAVLLLVPGMNQADLVAAGIVDLVGIGQVVACLAEQKVDIALVGQGSSTQHWVEVGTVDQEDIDQAAIEEDKHQVDRAVE